MLTASSPIKAFNAGWVQDSASRGGNWAPMLSDEIRMKMGGRRVSLFLAISQSGNMQTS